MQAEFIIVLMWIHFISYLNYSLFFLILNHIIRSNNGPHLSYYFSFLIQ